MNIVYLIGNGLDVKYKLKTQYKDFYENAYTPKADDFDYIKSLKEAIKDDINSWADLEKRFGEYSQKVDSEETYQKMFENVREKLIEYLKSQELKRELSDSERNDFIGTFRDPAQYLVEREKRQVNEFIQNKNKDINISLDYIYFITFNYTRTLEALLHSDGNGINIDVSGRRRLYINPINHIHGYTDDRFVLGVDNEDQILNTKFRSSELLDMIVKPQNNNIAGHMVDDGCENVINNAGIICIYGMSIGDTDKTWWKLIGKNLAKDIKLIIFWWDDDNISTLFNEKLFNKREKVKNIFLNETDLDEKQKLDVRNKIYVVIKEEGIFNIPKPEATLTIL
jgi:hypothetical protein